jgi:hypothetical protein
MFGVGELPGPPLHKEALHKLLKDMKEAGKFKRLVYYLETCYSGSMFADLDVPGVYAASSANATESGWGTYCPDDHADVVNGTRLGSCLGDGFGVSWMEDLDLTGGLHESLEDQYRRITARYTKSHVLQFGSRSFLDDEASAFIGNGTQISQALLPPPDGAQNSADAAMVSAPQIEQQYASTMLKSTAAVTRQESAEVIYRRMLRLAFPNDEDTRRTVWNSVEKPSNATCEVATHLALVSECNSYFNAASSSASHLHQVVVNLCAVAPKNELDVAALAAKACLGPEENGAVIFA